MIDIGVDSASVHDAFPSVPTVDVEEHVDRIWISEVGLASTNNKGKIKERFKRRTVTPSGRYRHSHCERASFQIEP